MILRYHLGLPLWGLNAWVGNFYRGGTRPSAFLAEYASVFNAVEGNTTFYQLPSAESVARWRETTPADFQFCLKLPRQITHEQHLEGAQFLVKEFFERVEPLGDRLGPFMVQLPPSFTPDGLEVLLRFLRALPQSFRYAVEVRHRAFFENRLLCRRLNDALAQAHVERVIMDTRALRAADPRDPDVRRAMRDKPDVPVQAFCLTDRPLVRFIGAPEAEIDAEWFARWSDLLSTWIGEGRRPYFFVHCANNLHAPVLARSFHATLARTLGPSIGELPAAPAARDEKQLGLFS